MVVARSGWFSGVDGRAKGQADSQADATVGGHRRGAIRHVLVQATPAVAGHLAIRDVFAEHLAMARSDHGLELYAWVVMPEHAHLIMRPRKGTELADALHSVRTSVAKRVVARWKKLRAPVPQELRTSRGRLRFWQKGGGFDRNARDADDLCKEIRYVHPQSG